ncbi:hypothetical protein LXD69_17635 [Flavobacterium sediminilitoris]|uniref:Immunity protein 30 of polymorphic toxin system n=1 Tax=Flavobacterium sediminilitoris TaxID=2024526 RepID=A0ABY4HNC8_9FLAO|nr:MULTISPECIES: hypothetical protein [Flavobacterium]UOX33842.1 hypothetical protein LXD69_17635 [Flavobacterium sediminilitoris]
MNIEQILLQINTFKVNEEMEDYKVSDFFDGIMESIDNLKILEDLHKEQLIKTLFNFLKKHNPEMEEDFSFIHLIESIDKPNYSIYSKQLIECNIQNPNLTSIILLNRYLNALDGDAWKKNVAILRSITEGNEYTSFIRQETLEYYQYQIDKEAV